MATMMSALLDPVVTPLRKTLTAESEPLARRFRALFSLKHLACLQPPTEKTLPAIDAIAAALSSQSALLKHELAYCLGQSKNADAVPHLVQVLQDRQEDSMCRHEAAEALGALGYAESLDILKALRDDQNEPDVVRETCDIAVDRILWETSEESKKESIKARSVFVDAQYTAVYIYTHVLFNITVILHLSIQPHRCHCPANNPRYRIWNRLCLIPLSPSFKDTGQCSHCATLPRLPTCQRRYPLFSLWLGDYKTLLRSSDTKWPLYSVNCATLQRSQVLQRH
jgi:hypothetical protein